MIKNELTDILRNHSNRYPEMQLNDYIKLIYQNEFGCGHMLTNLSDSEVLLKEEFRKTTTDTKPETDSLFIEPVGNGLCRINLRSNRLTENMLPLINRMFAATANTHQGSKPEFERKLTLFRQMADQGIVSVQPQTIDTFLSDYLAAGCPPLHHSENYRKRYDPHYRIIKQAYALYLPVISAIWELAARGKPAIIAIEGRCASGKSTLANLLAEVFDCNVFHMDDFFLSSSQRTAERLEQPGGNIDYERFLIEVMKPLREGKDVTFQPFCCSTGFLLPPVHVPARPLSIVEGSYSLHPALTDCYDFRIFLSCEPIEQKRRLLNREGPEQLERFLRQWIPLEEQYFSALNIAEHSNMVVDTTDFVKTEEVE